MLPGGLSNSLDLFLDGRLFGADAVKLHRVHFAQLLAVFTQCAQFAVVGAALLAILGDLRLQGLHLSGVHLGKMGGGGEVALVSRSAGIG